METKLFYNDYEIHLLREIRRESKNQSNTDLNKLKENLAKRNIHVNFEVKNGTLRNISFKKDKFEISSIKGNDRVFTDRILKSIDDNKKCLEQSKKEELKPKYNRFEELKKHREQVANQEKSKNQYKAL